MGTLKLGLQLGYWGAQPPENLIDGKSNRYDSRLPSARPTRMSNDVSVLLTIFW